jgi:hypothetical protein
MDSKELERSEREFCELIGAVDAINTLKKELELRLDEARDDCVREVLDNVINLVDAHCIEFRHRQDDLRACLDKGTIDEPEQ